MKNLNFRVGRVSGAESNGVGPHVSPTKRSRDISA